MANTVYLLKNHVNDKVYVGQTWETLKQRWGHGYKTCTHLYNAINKYGKDKFYYELLTSAETQEQADALEVYYIKHYNSIETGYNLKEGGSHGKHSETTKAKMSKMAMGKPGTNNGKKFSDEWIAKIAASNKGKMPSNKGKKFSKEHCQKISKALTGKHPSDTTRQKMSDSRKGIIVSDVTKAKLSATTSAYWAAKKQQKAEGNQ